MATFIWPTDTKRITSHFRPSHRKNHNGLDIADPGHHEIKAAAAGTVRRSYRSTSYGECIMIEHSIGGDTWETVYAHMRSGSRRVSEGQSVKQGQVIGVMGNTGHSTGQHLHFELHKNGLWNMQKSNAVDPLKYLEKNLYSANLTVDGKWGKATTKALQKSMGTPVDGIISNQPRNSVSQSLYGNTVQFGSGGSPVIKALQKKVGSKPDGKLGPDTARKLQKHLGTVVDGKFSRPSLVVKEMQKRLNAGTF